MEGQIHFGCSEQFAELCALSTSGCLDLREEEQLSAHLAVCAECALLLNQYRAVASDGMATLASTRVKDPESPQGLRNAHELKAKVLAGLEPLIEANSRTALEQPGFFASFPSFRFPTQAWVAAMVVFAVAAGYVLGTIRQNRYAETQKPSVVSEAPQANQIRAELITAKQDLATASAHETLLQARAEEAENNFRQLQQDKAAVDLKLQALTSQVQIDGGAIASLTAARQALEQRLHESEGLLETVQQQLKSVQNDRQGLLLRAANLEFQVNQLSAELHDSREAAGRTEQYLASDRDVRELMGARQLYIADVFDIDPQGRTKKPFGRVFYTKGKSLIFYAFDLDQQPGYKEAKTFQAWGKPGVTNGQPISLGIFYLDNEKNRRWALKSTDPRLLDEINSLFVTVEPKGGSTKPTNKPFLVAYLHSAAPNHP